MAVADELAAAADLVKGKVAGIPVAVIRGLKSSDDGSGATDLLRSGHEDLFWLGTAEALAQGRGEAQLLRHSVRAFSGSPVHPELITQAVAESLTAPAPHHTHPVRFVWLRSHEVRARLLAAMREQWRIDLTADGLSPERVERRIARGSILFDAPEVIVPFCVPDGAHDYPDAHRRCAESTMFTVPSARRCKDSWFPSPQGKWAVVGSDPPSLRPRSFARNWVCRRTGSRSAPWRSATPPDLGMSVRPQMWRGRS